MYASARQLIFFFSLNRQFPLTNPNRNSTSSPFAPALDTYWGQFEEISKYNIHLNILERLWATWYAYLQNDILATGIMSFVMHEIIYFGRALPWVMIDRIPYFNKYKIQNVSITMALSDSIMGNQVDAFSSKKSRLFKNNGIARSLYFYLTSPSNYHKYGMKHLTRPNYYTIAYMEYTLGYSIPWLNTLAWPLACHFLLS